jgi:transcriptional antiterminator RfaH
MPLLPPEPFVFPEDLLARAGGSQTAEGRWWALYTRPRAEKSLARRFLDRGVSFFLPLARRQWRTRGRLFTAQLPLFPGYVFLHGDGQARQQALQTNLVVHCLPVADQEQLQTDLDRIHRLILSDAPLTPEDRFAPGDWVEITAGPFAGIGGKILRRGKQTKLLVEVRFLQRGVSVEIESWMLQPALAGAD